MPPSASTTSPRRVVIGAGVRALLRTEQLALEQVGRDGADVHRHQPPRPAAQLMDAAGEQLLAGAGLALHEHGAVGERQHFGLVEHREQAG